ncbi:MAG TPA: hypothetical protein VMI54_22960 [Polyangiaceae bacterium]|nr:hypothetical protein [Polyangiaceae bacterium]
MTALCILLAGIGFAWARSFVVTPLAAEAAVPPSVGFSVAGRADRATGVACIAIRAQARYGALGYDHVVALYSSCGVRALCRVSTNVNPTPADVEVPPGKRVEVITFRGSPARTFTPNVECRLVS